MIFDRLNMVAASKANTIMNMLEDPTIVNMIEDPNKSLDMDIVEYSENLKDIQSGIAEIVTVKKRLETSSAELQLKSDAQQRIANDAVSSSNVVLARAALANKDEMDAIIRDINAQITEIATHHQKLIDARGTLQNRIEESRKKKELSRAVYNPPKIEVNEKESLVNISGEIVTGVLPSYRAVYNQPENEVHPISVESKPPEFKKNRRKRKKTE